VSRIALYGAAISLFLMALFAVLGRNLFLPGPFADRTAESLRDPGVAAYVADQITNQVVAQKPDLVGARPLILLSVNGIVQSRPFRAVARRAALRAHQAVFSESSREIVLSIPDLDILVRSALSQAAPEVAQKIPTRLTTKLAEFGADRRLEFVVDLWRLGRKLRWLALFSLIAAPVLLALAMWLAPHRQRMLVHAGFLIGLAGFAVLALLPLGRLMAATQIHDPLVKSAVDGALRTYFGPLRLWAVFLIGLGMLFASAGSALLQRLSATEIARWATSQLSRPLAHPLARAGRGVLLGAFGLLLVMFPGQVLQAAVLLFGALTTLLGMRELFGLVLSSMPVLPGSERPRYGGPLPWRAGLVLGLMVIAAVVWLLVRNPQAEPALASSDACNGHPELCDRRVDEVVFPASHNSMSNAKISDWMFPHHLQSISEQLEDGIRVLLIDVHRGFSGASRIKTDLEGQKMTKELLTENLGPEGMAAAMRIRERLVGVDEQHPRLYLCHGFCELGAYEFEPTLQQVHEFLVAHPDEVLILVLEAYVTIEEIVPAFEESGLKEFVYTGPSGPWPTLRELIDSGQRLIVFLESGAPGVPWLRPTIGNIQETPYFFHSPAEFSERPNRGGTQGSLYQMNHWIQTTPAPKPENAVLVNAKDVLLTRARRFQAERGHLPNIVAVDFYSIGDLFAVVDSLNGVRSPVVP
jgi:hypothetical protein